MFLNFEPCFPLQSSLAELIWSFNFSAIGRSPSKAPKILTCGKQSFQLSNWEIWGAPWCSFSASCQEEGEWHCRAPFVVRSVCEAGLQIKPIDYERVKISGSKCFGTLRTYLCVWYAALSLWSVHNITQQDLVCHLVERPVGYSNLAGAQFGLPSNSRRLQKLGIVEGPRRM